MKITPTVGRVVWYCLASLSGGLNTGPEIIRDGKPIHGYDDLTEQPLAASITFVHGPDCINIAGFDANGNPFARTSVLLWDGEGTAPTSPHVRWMPYQQGQAKAAETKTDGKGDAAPSDHGERIAALEQKVADHHGRLRTAGA